MKKNNLFEYCRIIAAVLMLSLVLAFFEATTLSGAILKYISFALCIFIAGFKPNKKQFKVSSSYAFICAVLIMWLSSIISYIMPSASGIDITAVTIISAVFIAPIFEEIFFRACLSSLPFYHITSAVIFALFHSGNRIQAFLLGVILAVFYTASSSLSAPIIAHMANNALAVTCMFYDVRPIVIIVGCLIIALVFYRKRK